MGVISVCPSASTGPGEECTGESYGRGGKEADGRGAPLSWSLGRGGEEGALGRCKLVKVLIKYLSVN